MSIVGPRPERRYFADKIIDTAPYYALTYQVRPGITSWGMVKFGYAQNVDEMIERSKYDLIYLGKHVAPCRHQNNYLHYQNRTHRKRDVKKCQLRNSI